MCGGGTFVQVYEHGLTPFGLLDTPGTSDYMVFTEKKNKPKNKQSPNPKDNQTPQIKKPQTNLKPNKKPNPK